MLIQRLQVQNVRNLSGISLSELHPVNIFFGANGSGKTSLLEAIHLLLVGRSFRHAQLKPVLSEGQLECVVFGELLTDSNQRVAVGQQRRSDSKPVIKLNGERIASLAELVEVAPVQVLNTDSFELLVGGPSHRREFMDWGLFHVEPTFYATWRQAQRALKQRNGLIRHGKIDRSQIQLWSREYARYGEELAILRRRYVEQLDPVFRDVLSELNLEISQNMDLVYSQGWARDQSLEQLLIDGIDRDLQQGFTRVGPHRADLRVQLNHTPAAEVLSRGQLKLVVAALRLAQAILLQQLVSKKCIFLVDDLPAELDRRHRQRLCRLLEQQGMQVMVTCIEHQDLSDCWGNPERLRMFHVERGTITPATPLE